MRDAAVGIVFDETRTRVLVVRRRDVPVWVLPGGGIDTGESPSDTVVREIREETGYRVEVLRQVGTYRPINKLASNTATFECRLMAGAPRITDETQALGFYPVAQLPQLFFPLHLDWIHDALEGCEGVVRKDLSHITYSRIALEAVLHPVQGFRYLLSRCGIPLQSG